MGSDDGISNRREVAPSGSRRDSPLALAIVAGAVLFFVAASWQPYAHIDDAYISYRYAQNLAEGHGLVFNVGERVEGITNLGWTLLIAAGMKLGFSAPTVSQFLGIACGAGVLALTYATARLELPVRHRWAAALAPWLLLAPPAFSIWSWSGLETPLFTLLATAALFAEARGSAGGVAMAAIGGTLVRPEGVLSAAIAFGSLWRRRSAERRSVLTAIAVYAAFTVALTVFRLAYYGVPLPNTFYAKVRPIPAVVPSFYLGSFVLRILAPLAWPAVIAVRRVPSLRPAAAWIATLMIYSVAVGGDVFPHCRFLVPALPALSVLAVRGAVWAWQDGSSYGARFGVACIPLSFLWMSQGAACGAAATAILLLFMASRTVRGSIQGIALATTFALACGAVMQVPVPERRLPHEGAFAHVVLGSRADEIRRDRAGNLLFADLAQDMVRLLKSRDPQPRFVVLGSLGVIGYLLPIRMVDLFGLVDPEVRHLEPDSVPDAFQIPGHQWSNAAHIIALHPDCIIGDPTTVRLPAILALARRYELWHDYEATRDNPRLRCLRRPTAPRRSIE